MPLSGSDVAYINKLMDRHLKNQQSWPWMRYFILACGLCMIGFGIAAVYMSDSMAQQFTSLATLADRTAETTSTKPVTQAELKVAQGLLEIRLKMHAWSSAYFAGGYIMGWIICLLGLHQIAGAITKWNKHRRDAILITLLREKCAAELAQPNTQANRT